MVIYDSPEANYQKKFFKILQTANNCIILFLHFVLFFTWCAWWLFQKAVVKEDSWVKCSKVTMACSLNNQTLSQYNQQKSWLSCA